MYRVLQCMESICIRVNVGGVRTFRRHPTHGLRRTRHVCQVLHPLQPPHLPLAQTQFPPPALEGHELPARDLRSPLPVFFTLQLPAIVGLRSAAPGPIRFGAQDSRRVELLSLWKVQRPIWTVQALPAPLCRQREHCAAVSTGQHRARTWAWTQSDEGTETKEPVDGGQEVGAGDREGTEMLWGWRSGDHLGNGACSRQICQKWQTVRPGPVLGCVYIGLSVYSNI